MMVMMVMGWDGMGLEGKGLSKVKGLGDGGWEGREGWKGWG